MSEGRRLRTAFAAIATVFVVALGSPPGLANQDGGNDNNEQQQDTQSRHEQETLNSIPLQTRDGRIDIHRLLMIQSRYNHFADSFFENLGISFDDLDRADVSEIPLLGSFFEAPLRREDLTEENRVGSVYRGADGTLVAVLEDEVEVAGSEVSVVNGKGRYTFNMMPQLIQVDPVELDQLAELPSVQTLVQGTASRETTIVLSGLTATSAPEVEGGVPVLKDIPGLRMLFVGDMFEVEDTELVILVRPTIITGDEVEG